MFLFLSVQAQDWQKPPWRSCACRFPSNGFGTGSEMCRAYAKTRTTAETYSNPDSNPALTYWVGDQFLLKLAGRYHGQRNMNSRTSYPASRSPQQLLTMAKTPFCAGALTLSESVYRAVIRSVVSYLRDSLVSLCELNINLSCFVYQRLRLENEYVAWLRALCFTYTFKTRMQPWLEPTYQAIMPCSVSVTCTPAKTRCKAVKLHRCACSGIYTAECQDAGLGTDAQAANNAAPARKHIAVRGSEAC